MEFQIHLSGYGAYKLYLALKTHFTTEKYDYIKFKGKVRASKRTYEARHDRYFFEKLARKFNALDLRDFFIANLVEGNTNVVDMLGESGQNNYIMHTRYNEALEYNFREDTEKIYSEGVLKTFNWKKGEYPRLIILYMNGTINIESLVILDSILPNYRKKFDRLFDGDVLWVDIRRKIDKIKPFVKFDREKAASTIREKIHEFQREKNEKVPTEGEAH